jgi:hypothetical protein
MARWISRRVSQGAAASAFAAALAVSTGCGVAPSGGSEKVERTAQADSTGFTVSLTRCVESIGVGLVPTASARAYVPAKYVLVGDGQPVTPLVVRTSRCEAISVAGREPERGAVAQVGAVIVPPDFTGDIDNYTFFYFTTSEALASSLSAAGVDARHVADIDYDYDRDFDTTPDGDDTAFAVRVPARAEPGFALAGTVSPSYSPSGSFLANWWQDGASGTVKMSTDVPVIDIGGASLTMTTDPGDALGQLFGAGTVAFPVLQQFNLFRDATLTVSVAP